MTEIVSTTRENDFSTTLGTESTGIGRTETTSAAQRHPFPALPAGHAPDVALPDVIMRMAQDSTGSLQDRRITVTGSL